MGPSDISIRPFTWADVPAAASLQAGLDPPSPPPAAAIDGLRRWLADPGAHPERDGLVASADGVPVGWAYLVAEPLVRRGVLLSDLAPSTDHVGVGEALLDAGAQLGRTLGYGVLHMDVPESAVRWQASLAAAGLSHVRSHNHLQRTSTDRVDATVQPGGSLALAGRGDVEELTQLQNAAFTGSWGFCPNTPEEIAYRVFELPDDPPDPVVLLRLDGVLVAYAWTHQETPDSPGVVGMVGVWPDLQGRGYGAVVTAAGMNHLIDIGATPLEITVDAQNTPAVRLYERMGFVPSWRSFWYELQLD